MNRKNIVKLLNMLDAEKVVESHDWIRCSCLFAPWTHSKGTDSRPSFGISIGRQSHYYCFSCQRSGPLTTLVSSYCMVKRKDNPAAREFVMKYEHIGLESPFEDLGKSHEPLSVLAPAVLKRFTPAHTNLAFVRERNISPEAIKRFGLRYDPTNTRLIFPVYDRKGQLVGIRGRATTDSFLKYKEYSDLYPNKTSPKAHGIWWGMQFPPEKGKKLFLVEGEIDALSLWQKLKRPGIWAAMGVALSPDQIKEIQGSKNPVVLFFDNDEAGYLALEKLRRKLVNVIQGVYVIRDYGGCKDPDEIVQKGKLAQALKSMEQIG